MNSQSERDDTTPAANTAIAKRVQLISHDHDMSGSAKGKRNLMTISDSQKNGRRRSPAAHIFIVILPLGFYFARPAEEDRPPDPAECIVPALPAWLPLAGNDDRCGPAVPTLEGP